MTRLPGAAWSVLLAGAALVRATSYLLRPPEKSVSTQLIESVIPYHAWAATLIVGAAVVCVGVIAPRPIAARWAFFVGHLLLVFCYSTFAVSILVAAIAYGGTWSTLGSVVVVALLHSERVWTVAEPLGRRR